MLKRLELVGFKSFADKTQFDFASGITAIVGPNGSGKSNIVDAVRWILGEQSAKSLRGGEMADVIFNGSTTRRSLGLAEVTMTLDNTRRQLAIDAEEVHVTRRVYRSSEGEYLINHQVCRLKDVKDLFLGSGAGSHAYSIIEQGRVDVLLQASTKERRVIFEEAAGISRFKAKKIETLRKLERVDQNLQRLRDIVDEVSKQLRSVRLQASKAAKYKEYQQRLQELRVALGLHEYHQLTEALAAETAVLDRLRAELAQRTSETEGWETEVRGHDESLRQLDEAIHAQEERLSQAREQIVAADGTLSHERAQTVELERLLAQSRSWLAELQVKTAELETATTDAAREYASVEADCQQQRQLVQGMNEAHQGTLTRLKRLHLQVEADHVQHMEMARKAAHLRAEHSIHHGNLEKLQREHARFRQKGDQAAESLAHLDLELQTLAETEQQFSARLAATRQALDEKVRQRDRFRHLGESAKALAHQLREQRTGLTSRIEVLDGLERTHEGLGAGVREVFALLEQPEPGPWRTVLGMVADFLTVPREQAPLIDLALGEVAQRFLVRDVASLIDAVQQRGQPFSGRAGFLPIKPPGAPNVIPLMLPEFGPGVYRAVDLVACDHPELAGLPAQLLEDTLIVPDLDAARRIAAQAPGLRLLTQQGELLEADGSLTVGTLLPGAGILSRKSELRELRVQAEAMEQRIGATERDMDGLRQHESALEAETAALREGIEVLNEQVADLQKRIGQHQAHRDALHLEVETSRSDISRMEQEIAELTAGCSQAQSQAEEADRQVQAVQERLAAAQSEIRDKEQLREHQQQVREAANMALSRVEERLKALRDRHNRFATDLAQRQRERREGEQQLAAARLRWEENQRTMLQAQTALAHWYLVKEAAQRQVSQQGRARDEQRRQRDALAEQLQAVRGTWQVQQQQAHEHDKEASSLSQKSATLVERLREDYDLDLANLYRQALDNETAATDKETPEKDKETRRQGDKETEATDVGTSDGERGVPGSLSPCLLVSLSSAATEAANQEIEELRRKLSRLGNVNLEALQEQVELEGRERELKTQFDDLTASQRSLLEIIAQINEDSKKLFTETFTAVRGHFQELFRKLFGGGMADVILEDENDILECGVEINARPPGKELRSISLMSGGEKTMTAVALLLAIFRSKPSPFCILDEVDAALDEANIGRFSSVLREFLDISQFIIITHSKRTMQMADVLYGITMQESGISKRVAVRFEDWPDDSRKVEATGNGAAGTNPQQSFAGR